ncbi:MAG: phosphomannomutase/phosphoglucomutase [Methylococcaceae bacterium]|jgi:phosphomannomutase/phosphoglucomutase
MKIIFLLLAALTSVMVLVAGGGVYWLTAANIKQAQESTAQATNSAVAAAISGQIDLLEQSLNKMAGRPEVIAAMQTADPGLINATADNLQQLLPSVLKIRLLLPSVNQLDEQHLPRMGYADLDMVRESLAAKQAPAIQGDGEDRHLAIASRIIKNKHVIGILLASCSYQFISKSVQTTALKAGYLELQQESLVLAASGDQNNKDGADAIETKIANSHWTLMHWPGQARSIDALVLVCWFLPLVLVLLAHFIGFRKLSALISDDLNSVLKAAKDLFSGKLQGSYPVKLNEMDAAVATLAQFKRVYENQGLDTQTESLDLELYDFAEQSSDFGLSHYLDESYSPGSIPNIPEPTAKPAVPSPEPVDKTAPAAFSAAAEVVAPDAYEFKPTPSKQEQLSTVFSADGIIGIAEKQLTKAIAFDIGRALATEAKGQACQSLVIGHDARLSGPWLANSLAKGMVSTGLNVLDLGLVPSPLLYFVCQHIEGRSAAMVSCGLDSPQYNGINMVLNGELLIGAHINKLQQIVSTQSYASGPAGTIEQNNLFVQEYIGSISEDIKFDRPLKIVLDGGNGAAGGLGYELLTALGNEVIELFCDVDGQFPNHKPNPSKAENLADLISSVKHYQADLGIALDGSGESFNAVDSNGKIIWPDRFMMLLAKDLLKQKPGAEIFYAVNCNAHLAKVIAKLGGKATISKIAPAALRSQMKNSAAKMAGNADGHIFFNDRWFGTADAIYSATRLASLLSRDSRSSAEVFAEYPEPIHCPELEVPVAEGEPARLLEAIASTANFSDAKVINVDGVRVEFQYAWMLVQASTSTAALKVNFGADTKASLEHIQEQCRKLLKSIKPNIVLPF